MIVSEPRRHSSLAFRLTAVVAMLVWLVGQTLCLHHCAQRTVASGGRGCCAKKLAEKTQGSSRSPADGGNFTCGSLKLAKLETGTASLEFSEFAQPILVPTELRTLLGGELRGSVRVGMGPRPRADYVFRPAECFGGAFLGLAPPLTA